MPGGIITAVLSSGIVATLTTAPEVRVNGQNVLASDVASLSGIALGDVLIARIPIAQGRTTITRSQAAGLIRHAIPGVQVAGVDGGSITLRSTAHAALPEQRFDCLELRAEVPAGSSIESSDTASVECDAERAAAKVTRPVGTVDTIAAQALRTGEYLGRVQLSKAPIVRRGQQLTLTSSIGPVVISRPVTAMQAATSNQRRLFVRTGDGEVFAAPIHREVRP